MLPLIVSIAPVFIILTYIYIRDKYQKEPLAMLFKSLLIGALVTIPIILVELLLDNFTAFFPGLMAPMYKSFVVASFTEEGFKFLVFFWVIWRNKNFDEKFDGIVYAVFISLGFAMVENILYVFQKGIGVGLLRAFTAVPGHAFFGIIMGFHLGLAKFVPERKTKHLVSAFLMPFLFHGIYDFILFSQHPILLVLFLPFIVFLWILGFKRMKKLNIPTMPPVAG